MAPELAVFAVMVGLALVSMAVFALRAGGGSRDSLESPKRGTFLLGTFAREWFYWVLDPVLRIALALGASPLLFNLLGLGFAILAGLALAAGRMALGGWLVLIGGVCDSLDGRVARARGMDAPWGEFLDSTLDRFAELAAWLGLAVLFSDDPVAGPLLVGAVGGSMLVSYARARGESLGVVCARGVMQRTERLLLLGFSAILDPSVSSWLGRENAGGLLLPALALIAVGTLGTAAYRTIWIVGRLRSLPDSDT